MSRIEQLQEFMKESPNDSFLIYALALEYVKINKFSEAIKLFEGLVENDIQYLATYLQYGNLLAETDDIAKAEEIYNKGIEIARLQNNSKTRQEIEQALYLLD